MKLIIVQKNFSLIMEDLVINALALKLTAIDIIMNAIGQAYIV